MDQFDKGIQLMEQGIAKGIAKSADEDKLNLGMAYAKAGRKEEAVKTLKSSRATMAPATWPSTGSCGSTVRPAPAAAAAAAPAAVTK